MSAWIEALGATLAREGRAVVVTVAQAIGSTPRAAGTTMVVSRHAFAGTIGGGHLEHEALRLAREALDAEPFAPATWLVRFPLAARLGQCCGGVATLAFAAVDGRSGGWLDFASACARTAAPFAIASRIGAGEEAETRLVVTRDDARGTLGDGALDSGGLAAARARLARDPDAPHAATGVVEAAGTTLLVHVIRPEPFDVLVFGNGHVGRALVQVLGALPARVRWVDTREEDFPAVVPVNVTPVPTDDPAAELRAAPRGAYVVVMTHSHALDFDLVEAALARDDWRYLGLIGSRAKRAQFEKRLQARGRPAADAARIICPIGADAVRSKEPGAIAVAVAFELLVLREAAAGAQGRRASQR